MSPIVSKRVLEDIRFRCDIVEVIGSYITLQHRGAAFKALCPFHKEKTPSFNVNAQRQIFHCFGCGAGGDVFGFVMQHEGVDFTTAVAMLADRAGVKLELEDGRSGGDTGEKAQLFKIHAGIAEFYQRCLQMPAAEHARAYLASRALKDTSVQNFQVGYAPDRWDAIIQWGEKHEFKPELLEMAGLILRSDKPEARSPYYDRFRGRLMFPIRDEQSRVIGFSGRALEEKAQSAKYVNSPETPLFKKSRVLYAIDRARKKIVDAGEALICEGQIDVIRCHEAGFENAVAAQGTAFTEDHARIVRRYADSVVLIFDPDTAGQDAAIRASGVFMQAGLAVRIVTLPPKEDPDAFIRGRGAEAFAKLIAEASSVVDFQITVLSSRENVRSEVGTMRVSRAVLNTVAQSPNAVLRAKLVQEAAARLGVPASALLDDLRFQQARPRRESAPAEAGGEAGDQGKTPARIPEEVELCAHLTRVTDEPEVGDLVRQYLPLRLLQDGVCRRVAEACLQMAETGEHLHSVLEAAGDVDPEVLQFAAAVQSAPTKIRGQDRGHGDAVRDIILRLWRRELKTQRLDVEQKHRAAPAPELATRYKQITLDLDALKTWDEGVSIIEIEMG